MKSRFFLYHIIPFILPFVISCNITRQDMYRLFSTPSIPDIEVVGMPDQTGYFDFGSTEVYTTNFTVFNIENRGTGDLILKGLSFIEDNVTWYTFDTSQLSSIVPPGQSTTFKIKFKPTSVSTQSVTVIILNNVSDKSPYTFTVEGTGFGTPAAVPDIDLRQGTTAIPDESPIPISFGNVEAGSSGFKVFTIENKNTGDLNLFDVSVTPGGGTEPGEFNALAPSIPTTLPEGETVTFTVMFSPKNFGFKSATIDIINDDPDENPYTFMVDGDGSAVPEPDINIKQGFTDIPISTGFYNFGIIESSTSSSPIVFTIENNGNAPLNINSVTLSAGSINEFFVDTSGIATIVDPGSSTTFKVTFIPDAGSGMRWATVLVDNDDPDENLYDFIVEGEGVVAPVPNINVIGAPYDSFYDFGPVLLGTSKKVSFTIDNNGTGNLTIFDVINKDPAIFDLDDSMITSPIPPLGITNFDIKFTPKDTGEQKATIEIYSDDPDTDPYKYTVVAHGSLGPEPDINVILDDKNFPNDCTHFLPDTPVGGSSDPLTVIVENRGSGDLVLKSVLFTGDIESYDIKYDPKLLEIPPGDNIPITVWFIPKEPKKYAAKLEIESNDPDEGKFIVKLEGNGI